MTAQPNETSINMDRETEFFVFPASFAQQRLWFLDRLAPDNPFYNVSAGLRLTGAIEITALKQTFNEIVRRHETLRTTFVMLEGQPVQAISPSLTLPLPLINLQNIPPTQRETEARRRATEEAQRPFNLATGPLLRITLLKLSETEHILLLNLHHIVADGWSIGVLIRELGTLYTAFLKQERSPLLELPLQYADFAEWQREWLQGEVLENQLGYWRQQLNEIIPLNLPTDRTRSPIPTYRGAKKFLTLSPSLTEALKSFSQQEGVTLFMTLLAAFQTLLYRYTGQEDIAIGSPIANRNRQEIEGLIGFFVNSLVLRADLSGNPSFQTLLSRVKELAMGAYAHQDLPFEKLVEELHPERDLSRNPLFQVSFSLQNTPVELLDLPGLSLSAFEVDTATSKLDLEFHLWEDLKSIKGQVVYNTDLFDASTVCRLIGHFKTLLQGIVVNPRNRLSELPLLTAPEQKQLLIDWNDTQKYYPAHFCFQHKFEAQVERSPDAVAVIFENQKLTYRELNNHANQLAHYLQQLGVVPKILVGICLERSLETIVGFLAILKVGGVYLPLDPTYPQERLNFMLKDTGVSILLTQQEFSRKFPQERLSIVNLDREKKAITKQSPENLAIEVTPDNLAYVIYTSGSTGKPKGVLIEHRGLCNLAEAQIHTFNVQPNSRVLQFASASFDASIFEIIMALGSGATLYLAKKKSLLPGKDLIQFLSDHAIAHATLPPAVLAALPTQPLPALQTLVCAGESCSSEIVKRWASKCRFFNAYGPTETTVWSSVAEITDRDSPPPIGRPIINTQLYILDKHLQPVPIGITGELYIGGDGVARGYLNRPELTAERFIFHLFSGKKGARLYKTGDLARYRPDGNIEFLGRLDHQVKIRGYRIELGEIEAVLNQHPAVKTTVAIAQISPDIATEDASENKRLVAYIVPHPNITVTPVELRNYLKEKLPDYAIPNAFVVLDSLPLTHQGKIDRKRLAKLKTFTIRSRDTAFIAPRTSSESTLAKIWAEVLSSDRISIRDNFFDLGGDSLLAIRLIDRIQKQFKRELSLSDIFLYPTVESLANTLSLDAELPARSPLIAIQSQGSQPPFFCIHPILGVVFPYYELAYHLGKERPFYGLQPKGIDGKEPPLTSIEDMAGYYIKALRVVQPQGPYFLGGWSFGGLVAFEMAQQLQRDGHQVALLAVFDTLAPVAAYKPSFWDGCKFLFTTVSRYIWPFLQDYFYLMVTYKNENKTENINRINPEISSPVHLFKHAFFKANIAHLLTRESKQQIFQELTLRPMFPIFQANSQAVLNYTPQIYPSRITLFKSSEQPPKRNLDPTLGWSELSAESVEVIQVSGNHLTMLKKPHVQVLAEQLRQCF